MWLNNSSDIKQYMANSKFEQLHRWLSSFQDTYGDSKKLPMPTTCCWTLVESNDHWIHVQYFILLDVLKGFDVSSDLLHNKYDGGDYTQLGGTFFGPLVDHATSAPLYF